MPVQNKQIWRKVMANIRVRDFAKDLGKESKELVSILKAQGIEKTPASNIDDAQQKLIRDAIGGKKEPEKQTAPVAEKEKTEQPVKAEDKKSNITSVYNPQNSNNNSKNNKNGNNQNRNNQRNGQPRGENQNRNNRNEQNRGNYNQNRNGQGESRQRNFDNRNGENANNNGSYHNNNRNDQNRNDRNNDRGFNRNNDRNNGNNSYRNSGRSDRNGQDGKRNFDNNRRPAGKDNGRVAAIPPAPKMERSEKANRRAQNNAYDND